MRTVSTALDEPLFGEVRKMRSDLDDVREIWATLVAAVDCPTGRAG